VYLADGTLDYSTGTTHRNVPGGIVSRFIGRDHVVLLPRRSTRSS
jgi:hypothetical protein